MSSSELNKDNKTAAIGLLDRLALDGENLAPTDKKSIDELKSVLGNDLFQALLDIQGYQSHTVNNDPQNNNITKVNHSTVCCKNVDLILMRIFYFMKNNRKKLTPTSFF